MLNEILNLEGVAVLSKEQQKSVNGGGYYFGTPTCNGIGYRETINGKPVLSTAYQSCNYSYQRTFIGIDWGSSQTVESPCPDGFIC
jgi:hypothetical protein